MTTTAKEIKPVAPPSVPQLAADLDAGLRRLKLAAIRRTAPEVLLTAKTQRWTPEEVLSRRTYHETHSAYLGDPSVTVGQALQARCYPEFGDAFGPAVHRRDEPQGLTGRVQPDHG